MSDICDISIFTNIINDLNVYWVSLSTTYFNASPKQSGLSFGSCYTTCGSLGLTDVSGLTLSLDYGNAIATFTTCNRIDYAVLTIPFVTQAIAVDLQARASSPNTLWPTNPGDEYITGALANMTGFLLVYVPVTNERFEYSRVHTDFVSFVNWDSTTSATWPDQGNLIFNAIDFNSILQQWNVTFIDYIRSSLCKELNRLLQDADQGNNCEFPPEVAQSCAITTSMPGAPCHPCDTCCKCLVQERCDGSCSECECVNCIYLGQWSTTITISICLIVAFFVAWFIDLFSLTTSSLYARPHAVSTFPNFV